jgi:hypothetical protein
VCPPVRSMREQALQSNQRDSYVAGPCGFLCLLRVLRDARTRVSLRAQNDRVASLSARARTHTRGASPRWGGIKNQANRKRVGLEP